MPSVRPFSIRARASALALALLVLAATQLVAPADAALISSGDGVSRPVIYQGDDTTVLVGAYNYQYLGTQEILGCQNRSTDVDNVPICRAWVPTGYSKTYIRLRNEPQDPIARAGVGLQYTLARNCVGQPLMPLTTSFTYDRWSNVSFGGVGSAANAEIWGNPLYGRGTVGIPEVPTEEHQLLEAYPLIGSGRVTKTLSAVDPPSFQNYTALAYSLAHATVLDANQEPAPHARADVGMYLHEIKFDWTDTVKPTISRSFEVPPGAPAGFTGSGDGYTWFKSDVDLVFTTNDAHSCPKHAHHRVNAGAWQSLAINREKDPVRVPFWEEGKYTVDYYAEDYQGTDSSTYWVKLGVDKHAPNRGMGWNGPDGENGWYKTRPVVNVLAWDDVSGFWKARYRFDPDDGWLNWPDSDHNITLSEGAHELQNEIWDKANWLAYMNQTFKVDPTPPSAKAWCTPQGGARAECNGAAGAWYNKDLLVELECTDDTSLCALTRFSLDGAPAANYTGAFNLTAEGVHTLWMEVRDHAGHVVERAYTIRLDKTPPTAPTLRETHGKSLLNVNPEWEWSATDNLSGGVKYSEWFKDGGNAHSNTSYDTQTKKTFPARDGENCLNVVAKDLAGNIGARSGWSCVLVDKTLPTLEVFKPVAGGVYVRNQHVLTIPGNNPPAVVLGPITFETRARDLPPTGLSYASGLQDHWTLVDGRSWTPTEGAGRDHCALDNQTCRQTYSYGFWAYWYPFNWVTFHTFDARAKDWAENVRASPQVKFDYVMLLVISGNNAANLPAMDLHWLPYDGNETFVRYEIHRSLTAGFTPSAATKAAEIADPAAQTWQDVGAHIQPGVRLHYKVVVVTDQYDPMDPLRTATNEYPGEYTGVKSALMRDPTSGA